MERITNTIINNKNRIIGYFVMLVLMPVTIFLGIFLFRDRGYFIISLVVITYTMVAFFFSFERRKPMAREIVTIAVLVGIAVAGRCAFFMIPQFKPVAAIVIIAGVCFGGQTGFLVGAMSAFVSNFFFGQGPLTPWQMFGFGIIGLLAGILFNKRLLPKKIIPLCVFGGISTFVLYGLIVNLGSLLMYMPDFSVEAYLASIIAAIPFDLTHAIATVIFLALIAKPMIKKLDRVKTKFGFE